MIPATVMMHAMPVLAAIAREDDAVSFLQRATEPLQHSFMIQAMVVAALIGCVCAVLSCYLVLKGWSLMGDAISHAVLPGIIIAYVISLPMIIGAFVAGMVCAVSTGWIKSHSRVKEDTVLGIVFTGLFALGLVLMTKIDAGIHFDHIVKGNLLGITQGDLIQLIVITSVTLLVTLAKSRDLMLLCFDPSQAKASGLNTTLLYYLLLSLIAITVVAALQAVGFILTVAMLIVPGATGLLLCDRFGRMMTVAAMLSLISAVMGTYMSFLLDSSPAALIVLFQSGFFTLAVLFAPKHGLVAHKRQVRAAMKKIA